MGTESNGKAQPKVVKLDKAFKLAEAWVNCMSGSTKSDQADLEFEGRPPGLGLGAKAPPKSKPASSIDPVERKLLAKLKASKAKNVERANEADEIEPSEDDDDEPQSRAKAFVKKRAMPQPPSVPSTKRRK